MSLLYLEQLHQKREELNIQRQILIEDNLPKGVKAQLLELDQQLEKVSATYKEIELEVREDVLELEETLIGEILQVIYNKPRMSWDSNALEGYAVAHPEILVMRKEGQAWTTIKKINS